MLIDTHCHIHDFNLYTLNPDETIIRAHEAGVMQMICIGTNVTDSRVAVKFASSHEEVYASVGAHPHELKDGLGGLEEIIKSCSKKIVAIGEIGLDYHTSDTPHDEQIQAFETQIQLALKYDLPIIFHVREAFDDFWPVFDKYQGIRGVLHSFTDTIENAREGLKKGLYIGVNGYSTFIKDQSQKDMFASLPLDKIILETDAPFLTPVPFRGKVNEPAFVRNIADYQSNIRQISLDEVAKTTTANAQSLFNL